MAPLPYPQYDEWITNIETMRTDLADRAEAVVKRLIYRRLFKDEVIDKALPVDELVHDGVVLAEYLVSVGVLEDTATGLGVTIVGYRFVAYVDQVNADLAAWLVQLLRGFYHANEAWRLPPAMNGSSQKI
jgi:hypothetical protein